MDVMLAAFRLVHAAGAANLAPVLSKTPGTLSHEVSPTTPHAKFGLADAVALTKWTGDLQILNAFAAEAGCMVVPLLAEVPGTEGVASRTAQLAREFGELMMELSTGLADGHVSGNELGRIEREGSELMAALQHLLAQVRSIHQRDVPAADEPAALRAVRGAA